MRLDEIPGLGYCGQDVTGDLPNGLVASQPRWIRCILNRSI